MELYKQIDYYFNVVNYTDWSVIGCKIQNPTFTSASCNCYKRSDKKLSQIALF